MNIKNYSNTHINSNSKVKKMVFAVVAIVGIISIIIFSIINQKRNDEIPNKIEIAVILPLTGQGAAAGESAKRALQFCADEWNSKGGVLGKKVSINFYDAPNADSKEGVLRAKKILSTYIPSLVIIPVSGIALSTQPIFEKKQVIQMAVATTSSLFDASPKYVIRNHITQQKISEKVTHYIANEIGKKEFKIIYANTEKGRSSLNEFKNAAEKENLKITISLPFNENETSFRNEILKCDLKDSDVLYVEGFMESLGKMVKQIKESGFNGIIIGSNDLNTNSARNSIGNNKNNVFYVGAIRNNMTDTVYKRYEERYSKKIDEISFIIYNGLDAFLSFVEEKQTLDNEEIMSKINGDFFSKNTGKVIIRENEIIYDLIIIPL